MRKLLFVPFILGVIAFLFLCGVYTTSGQADWSDLLNRALERIAVLVAVSVDTPRVSEGRLLPPAPPQVPCAIGLSYPPTVVCREGNGD